MSVNYPTNMDEVIDSRDVIAALDDLANLHLAGPVELDGFLAGQPVDQFDQDTLFHHERLLTELAKQGADYSTEWEDGETLIRDDHFQDFARELVEECGYFDHNAGSDAGHGVDWDAWPYRCIDWARIADELKEDYTTIQFDGVDYWIRSV